MSQRSAAMLRSQFIAWFQLALFWSATPFAKSR